MASGQRYCSVALRSSMLALWQASTSMADAVLPALRAPGTDSQPLHWLFGSLGTAWGVVVTEPYLSRAHRSLGSLGMIKTSYPMPGQPLKDHVMFQKQNS